MCFLETMFLIMRNKITKSIYTTTTSLFFMVVKIQYLLDEQIKRRFESKARLLGRTYKDCLTEALLNWIKKK